MTKRGKLSKADAFYAQQNPDNLSMKELASTLDRTIKQIERAQAAKPKAPVEQPANVTPEPHIPVEEITKEEAKDRGLKVSDLMARNERMGATVMTPAASELSDETRKRKKNPKNEAAIHKIRK